MLVLSRRSEESIIFIHQDGTRIEITVSQCKSGRATIKVNAPKEVRVLRKEIESKENHG